ncbi:alkane 1-monooxygenase [Pseudooceanicola nanhaiensis]|uniref:alkane 1-monooxygenase n=1 Tax=Pseudooceanicola nanhaiensis TaxID=375761 RepID=UPI001CD3BEDC|nr:alkane 1-monooxygenase [Pseudooceanicola nanhaiensis]MCA0922073.1 alkane 1-monooxygenase [Pseudooceanicola nanhaiensis]
MKLFAFATLLPVLLLGLAISFGGLWGWGALLYLTLFTAAVDHLMPQDWDNRDPAQEFPVSRGLSVVLGLAHLVLLAMAVRLLGGPGGAEGAAVLPALFGVAVFFGQVSHPNAHELIHQPKRRARRLGALVYTTMLFGHHASAHLRVHHPQVATEADPNTAPRGMSFYRYIPRAWGGSFRRGRAAERAALSRAGRSRWKSPYVGYVGGAAATVLLSLALAGWGGLLVLLALAVLAQGQILLSDYVQHYGLARGWTEAGRRSPVGPEHSWNAAQTLSAAMMLNAPRHSDHHVHPGRDYPALQLERGAMPVLPYSMPVMATLAMIPPLWFRVMHRELDRLAMAREA